jgi:predicted amino acid-binding ACT domain protein
MDQTNSLGAWRRQWVLTVMLFLLVLAGTAVAVAWMPRTYQAEGSVVLLASPAVARSTGDNPYLSFSESLTLTADVLSRELMAPGTVSGLAAHGFRDPYTVELAPYTTTTTGAVLTATVTGSDRIGVVRDLNAVMNQIQTSLAILQVGMKPYDRIRIATIAKSQWATVSVSETARPLTVIAAGGLLLVLGLPWLVDAQIARLQAGWAATAAEPPSVAVAAGEGNGWPADHELPDTQIFQPIASRPATRRRSRGPGRPR